MSDRRERLLRIIDGIADVLDHSNVSLTAVIEFRATMMREARDEGATLDRIASAAGLTRQRVAKILDNGKGDE